MCLAVRRGSSGAPASQAGGSPRLGLVLPAVILLAVVPALFILALGIVTRADLLEALVS